MKVAKVSLVKPKVELAPSPEQILRGQALPKGLLGPWSATSICGNNITSSCLYVLGMVIIEAQALAPVALLLAAGVLYLYRKIYTEVVEAIPLDGGAYNCLLNCTRKFNASFAASFTLLSYLATAIISAKIAAAYGRHLFPYLPPLETTALILVLCAGLTILGLTDSSKVAVAIFGLHLATLSLLIFWILTTTDFTSWWSANLSLVQKEGNWPRTLFLGFSVAMLGVSGFESSANYVEQQRPGVFRQTLRNMWLAVTVFNPLLALLALGLMPVPEITAVSDDLVGHLGFLAGGRTLHTLIMIDAVLVLSGAVLASYVGVSGLVRRMTLDKCFPQFLLKSTKQGSYPLIILGFMILSLVVLYLTHGAIFSLAGVYAISFLGVMTFFGVGNILLKVNRPELKRTYRAGWLTVIVGVAATSLGIFGNLVINLEFLEYFAIYFFPAVLGGILIYTRIFLLKEILLFIDRLLVVFPSWHKKLQAKIAKLSHLRAVVFVGLENLPRLRKAFMYLSRNEDSENVLVLRFFVKEDPEAERTIHRHLEIMQELYPEMTIEYQARRGEFNPASVEALSRELKVPKNMMFMGSLTRAKPFALQDLGGVRVIW